MTTPMIDPKGGYHKVPPAQIRIPNGVATISRPEALLKYGWKPASPERIAQEAEAERAVQRDLEFPVPELLVPRVNADWEPAGTVRVVADASNNLVAVTAADKRQYTLDAQREEFRLRQQQHQFTMRAIQKAKAAGDDVPALVARVAVLEDALVALLGNPAAGQVTGQVAGQVEKK
jgi:hypothetical protein